MLKMKALPVAVLLFLVAACAKTMPPTLDTRWVGKTGVIRAQSLPDMMGLTIYSLGLTGLKNMLAIQSIASPDAATQFSPNCIQSTPTSGSGQVTYNVTDTCKSANNWSPQWAPQGIVTTIDSSAHITKLTYNSTDSSASLERTISTQGQSTSAIHTLNISNENISITALTKNGTLTPGLYSFTYSGTIDYQIQYQRTVNNQTQQLNKVEHTAKVKLEGQLDETDAKNPKIELQIFTVNYQAQIGNQTATGSLTLSTAQTGFAALTNGVPVAKMAFGQTLNLPSSSASQNNVAVEITSSDTSVQLQSKGPASTIYFNSGSSNDRMQDLFNTANVAVTKVSP